MVGRIYLSVVIVIVALTWKVHIAQSDNVNHGNFWVMLNFRINAEDTHDIILCLLMIYTYTTFFV